MKTTISRQTTHKAARAIANDVVKHPRADTSEPAQPELSKKVRKTIDGIRNEVRAYFADASRFFESRDALAQQFMRAFEVFKKETKLGMADFVREFDPTVPVNAADYKRHSAYNAADHLRRLVSNARAAAKLTPAEQAQRAASKPLGYRDAFAELLAAVLPIISADQVPKLWETVKERCRWTDAMVKGVEDKVKSTDLPLIALRAPRGMAGQIPALRIAKPQTRMGEEQGDEEQQPRTGTHG